MPVIETQTITRRKIVRGVHTLRNLAKVLVSYVGTESISLTMTPSVDARSWQMDAPALREAAALFTEMADILEKGE